MVKLVGDEPTRYVQVAAVGCCLGSIRLLLISVIN